MNAEFGTKCFVPGLSEGLYWWPVERNRGAVLVFLLLLSFETYLTFLGQHSFVKPFTRNEFDTLI